MPRFQSSVSSSVGDLHTKWIPLCVFNLAAYNAYQHIMSFNKNITMIFYSILFSKYLFMPGFVLLLACCALSCWLVTIFCNRSVTVQKLKPCEGLFYWTLSCLNPVLRSRLTGIAWHWQVTPPKTVKWVRRNWGEVFILVRDSLFSSSQ